jgi:hypothetical protein
MNTSAIGDYPLTVKASAGTEAKTASLTLKVKAPPIYRQG